MQIRRWSPDGWTGGHENTVKVQPAFKPEEINAPFEHLWGTLEKGMALDPHDHPHGEIYVITRGKGIMTVANEEETVIEGDVIYIPPNTTHTIRNEEPETLIVFAVWYDETDMFP